MKNFGDPPFYMRLYFYGLILSMNRYVQFKFYIGGMHKPCGQPWGEGGSWNVHFTNKAFLVKLSTKGEGSGVARGVAGVATATPIFQILF